MIHDENNVLMDDELVVIRDFLRKSKHACLYTRMNILVDLSCWIIYEVIILKEPTDSLKFHRGIMVQNGEGIGILSAQSIGETRTELLVTSFHSVDKFYSFCGSITVKIFDWCIKEEISNTCTEDQIWKPREARRTGGK